MRDFVITLLTCSVTMSMLALFYTAITPLVEKHYSAKGRYYAWLVIVVGLIIPFRPQFDNAFVKVDMPSDSVMPIIQIGNREPIIIQESVVENVTVPVVSATPNISWWQIVMAIWLVGMISFLLYHAIKHYRFMKLVVRWSENITDEQILALYHDIKTDMDVSKNVGLKLCTSIGSPMMIGFLNPLILLPKMDFSHDELRLILRHELIHYKRKDLWYKCLVLIATAVHWFNPMLYPISKTINMLCELSCDDEVVHNMNSDSRQFYSETIIGVIRHQSKLITALSTSFYGGKRGMKKRIYSIMDTTKKRTGLAVICTVLVVTLVASLVFTFTESKDKSEIYENEEIGIGLILPPEYVGKYTVQSNDYAEAKYLTFLHTATYELLNNKYPNDSVGTLFRISRWPITDEEAVNNMSEMAIMLFQTDKFAYFLSKPTGVEYDESIPEPWQTTEYKTLAYSTEIIAEIVASVYPLADTGETVQSIDTERLNEIVGETNQPNEMATGILYVNERLGFSIEFPESWDGLYSVSENYVELNNWGAAGIIVYQKASHDSGTTIATGRLFSISRWIGTWTSENSPIMSGYSAVVLQTDKYTYMLHTPSGVEYNESDPAAIAEYKEMLESLDIIATSVKSVDTYFPIQNTHANSKYQTELDFLDSQEGKQILEDSYGAARAILETNSDELAKYLIDPSQTSNILRNTSNVFGDLVWFIFKFNLDSIISLVIACRQIDEANAHTPEDFRIDTTMLNVVAENDRYYLIPVVWDFWVDKFTGEVYVFYNGLDMQVYKFDPAVESALAFAG